MGEGGIFAIIDGRGKDNQWTFHGWVFREGRPTRLGPLLWKALEVKGLEAVLAEGPATPGVAVPVTHENPEPLANPWLYLLNPNLRRVALMVAAPARPVTNAKDQKHLSEVLEVRRPVKMGSVWYYSASQAFRYEVVNSFILSPETSPDWAKADQEGMAKRKVA